MIGLKFKNEVSINITSISDGSVLSNSLKFKEAIGGECFTIYGTVITKKTSVYGSGTTLTLDLVIPKAANKSFTLSSFSSSQSGTSSYVPTLSFSSNGVASLKIGTGNNANVDYTFTSVVLNYNS